jgi:phosphohistidine swiveling domain-containing protein
MTTYRKTYAVHNTLITYDVWEAHQTIGWKKLYGTGTPPAIFDVHAGVADVYYTNVFSTFRDVMTKEYKKDTQTFTQAMKVYQEQLDRIQVRIEQPEILSDIPALLAFAQLFQDAWIGLDMSYMPDYVALDTASERLSATVREQAFGFYIGADRLIRLSLEKLFPELGALSQYVTRQEVANRTIPKRSILEARAKHFIYYKGRVIVDTPLEVFCAQESIRIESIYTPLRNEIRGSVGAEGAVTGTAFLFNKKSSPEALPPGSILVAEDLELSDISLLEQASAVILDQGSYYGIAALAARTLEKPCLFGTKIATMVLQNGDLLRIETEQGTVRLLSIEEGSGKKRRGVPKKKG